jgi:DNA-binding response OmpR family regulator
LGEQGYQVNTATDGQRDLHHGLTRDYDVLLLVWVPETRLTTVTCRFARDYGLA